MFSNPCLGELEYEATTAAILMAGLSISFLVEYFAHRLAASRNMESGHLHSHSVMGGDKELATTPSPDGSTPASSLNEHQKNKSDALNALVLESGILFHSLRKLKCLTKLLEDRTRSPGDESNNADN